MIQVTIGADLQRRLRQALDEDLGSGDITTEACVDPWAQGHATVVAKTPGILCGSTIFAEIFRLVDPEIEVTIRSSDGDPIKTGDHVISISGRLSSILVAERTALNLLQHLSGIATLTSRFVALTAHTKVRIIDTRKTMPLWRDLQKYAVRTGGGFNHRQGLYDMFLIKENHIAAAGGIGPAIELAISRQKARNLPTQIEVEVRNLAELDQALEHRVDRIMLDNMDTADLRRAVVAVAGRCETEASGGVNLTTAADIAETGVDFISVGALTHSVTAMDFSLLIQ